MSTAKTVLRAAVLCSSAVLLLTTCVGISPERLDPELYSWPPQDPKVQLIRVLGSQRDAGGGGLRAWLGGGGDEPLFVRPYGVAWHGDDLLVADPGAGKVIRIAAGGRVSTSKESLLEGPVGVAVCAGGIIATDARAGTVALLDDRLRLSRWLARDLDRPTGVACLDGTTVVVTETGRHQLLLLAEDGSRRSLGSRGNGSGELNFPTSVAVSQGSLWVGDTLNFRVQQLDPESGAGLAEFGRLGDGAGEMPRIKGVAIDRDGHLWISDAYLDQVALNTTDGELLLTLGRQGSRPGELSFPAGIAAHADGRVVVVDSLNRRLQIFRLLEAANEGGEEEPR